jgi:hypothetical protein
MKHGRSGIILDPVDIAILKTCPMDEGGYFKLWPGEHVATGRLERPKVVTVEINREMPYVFGKQNGVHMSEVDFIIEEMINTNTAGFTIADRSSIMRSASQAGTRPPCRRRSAVPESFIHPSSRSTWRPADSQLSRRNFGPRKFT